MQKGSREGGGKGRKEQAQRTFEDDTKRALADLLADAVVDADEVRC